MNKQYSIGQTITVIGKDGKHIPVTIIAKGGNNRVRVKFSALGLNKWLNLNNL